MDFLIINVIILIITVFLLVILSMVWPPDSPWSPWWKTDGKIAKAVCELAGISKKDVVYELGSGNATFLMVAAKEYGAKGVGIEIDPLRVFISKILLWVHGVSKKVVIKRGNFFDYDISDATVVFVYLVPKALKKLLPKFKKELKKGTSIVSYVYEIDLPPKKFDKKNKLRLYIVKKNMMNFL